ncbi:MAG: LysR family transcriptional regulator [Solirubrobacteraceae bacterium]|jgi:DNA-binding transcriptional LysR family regulator
MLNVGRLAVLRAVARERSFSGAAESLGYTQPAVSRQVATLEAETGAVLVTRAVNGARLTDAGEVLVRHAEVIFAALDDAESELRAVIGLEAGRVRLATFASAAASIVPLAIARFREFHPGVELVVEMMEEEESIPRLRCGELDIALSNDAECVPGEPLERVHLFDDPMYVALPPGHPLADRRTVRLRDLAHEPWMLGTTTTCPDTRMFKRACHGAGFEPRIAFENDDYHAILGFVAAGVAVALIPDLAARRAREDVVIRSLGAQAPVRHVVAAVPSGYRAPAADAMLTVLCEVGSEWERAGQAFVYA